MTQLNDGGRQPGNREERSLSASTVIARWQGNGWDEPCKSRGLRTVLWAAGGEIPPADPADQSYAPAALIKSLPARTIEGVGIKLRRMFLDSEPGIAGIDAVCRGKPITDDMLETAEMRSLWSLIQDVERMAAA